MRTDPVILLTGASDGLGRALAQDLAERGATVLLHGRSPERLSQAIEEIRAATGSERLRPYVADFASLADIRRLAGEVTAAEPRLDVLINNAGIGTTLPEGDGRVESADGYELRFQVNYLSGFLLTRLLEGLLVRSAPSRVVMVSSAGQMPIDFEDWQLEHGYDGVRAYCQSKLAQIMFAIDESQRLEHQGVTVNSLHPATYMPTKIVLAAGATPASSIEDGVRATRQLAFEAPGGRGGLYFNGLREARANGQAYDADARRQLRELSERLTGLA